MTDELPVKPFDRRELKSCFCCGKGVMHNGSIYFYEIQIGQCVVDLDSVKQQHGLELMMGAASAIAAALSPTTNVAHRLPPSRHLFCSECMTDPRNITVLAMTGGD